MAIIPIYKPKGWTSFDVVAKMRGKLHIRKMGHAGTLDPMAEGVLILLTESDTKKQEDFKLLTKNYLAKIVFGFETDTHDAAGTVLLQADTGLSQSLKAEQVEDALASFVGKLSQKVPAYSAVKIDGRRLYKLARSNSVSESELPEKEVEFFEITLLKFYSEKVELVGKALPVAEVFIKCSSGTYVRSLVRDLGRKLGTLATLTELKRTAVGDYRLEDCSMELYSN